MLYQIIIIIIIIIIIQIYYKMMKMTNNNNKMNLKYKIASRWNKNIIRLRIQ
jgi:cell division protein FtsL